MNRRLSYLGGAAASAVVLSGIAALPAQAATGDTVTTFAVAGGTLSIAVQATADLGTGTTGTASVSGQLGNVSVTDARGGRAGWSAKATSTTFTTGTGNPASTSVSYNAGVITTTGTSVMPPAVPVTLSATPATVVSPTSQIGNNTASWNPTLTVSLPSNALAGSYTGTINTSVS